MLEGKIEPKDAQNAREAHWAEIIDANLTTSHGTALIRADALHLTPHGEKSVECSIGFRQRHTTEYSA